jgi:hypothetical protein
LPLIPALTGGVITPWRKLGDFVAEELPEPAYWPPASQFAEMGATLKLGNKAQTFVFYEFDLAVIAKGNIRTIICRV